MKRILCFLLAFALTFSLAACSGDKADPTAPTLPSGNELSSEAVPTPTAKPTPTPTPEPTPEPEPASRIGESVFLGTYEQDNDLENGPEPIEWIIINEDETSYQLISKYVLDFKNFHNREEDVCWETSDIRAWLNGDFYNGSFTDSDKSQILLTKVDNSEELIVTQEEKVFFNPSMYGYHQGNDTEDYIYLLSDAEVRALILRECDRMIADGEYKSYSGMTLNYDVKPNTYATAYSYQIGIEYNKFGNQIKPETGLCAILTRTRTDDALCRAANNYGEQCVYVLHYYLASKCYDHWRQPFGIQPVINISK